MVRVLTVAGELLADFPGEDVDSVLSLKLHLAKLQGISRFRQRLLMSGSILEDDTLLQKGDMQLVVLQFSSMSSEQALTLNDHAESGDVGEVEHILQTPLDPNDAHRYGYNPLIAATANCHTEVVNLLLEARADVASRGESGWGESGETALVLAADIGSLEITTSLLKAGAGRNAEERHWAIYRASFFEDFEDFEDSDRYPEVVKLLVEADLNDGLGQRGLASASAKGEVKIVRLLLKAGCNPDLIDDRCRTALMWAALKCKCPDGDVHVRIVRLLLRAGASKDLVDNDGNTALTLAADQGNAEIVHILLAAGADRTLKNNDGFTALQIASDLGWAKVMHMLRAKVTKQQHAKHIADLQKEWMHRTG